MQDVDTKEESYCPDYHNRKKEKERERNIRTTYQPLD